MSINPETPDFDHIKKLCHELGGDFIEMNLKPVLPEWLTQDSDGIIFIDELHRDFE